MKLHSALVVHWKDWCWSWNSNTLATWCKELTHLRRSCCWERLRAGGEGDDRGWNGWMASLTQLTWVWVDSGSWWWIGRPGMLWFMELQRVGHDWATELNLAISYKIKCTHIIFLLGISAKDFNTYIHTKPAHRYLSSSIHNYENLETTKLFFIRWMDK